MKYILMSVVILWVLSACAGVPGGGSNDPTGFPPDSPVGSETPSPSGGVDPLAPQPGDSDLQRGPVFIDSATILAAESYPVQYALSIKGNLPTPCHQLRAIVSGAADENALRVEVYSLVDPEVLCAQVLQAFEVNLSLPDGMEPGEYTVIINGELTLPLFVQ